MKRILLLSILLTLMACGDKNTTSPIDSKSGSLKSEVATNYDTIKQFSVINSGYREFQGQPAAWIMFSKPVSSTLNINQFLSLTNKQGAMAGAWQIDNKGINAYYANIEPDKKYTIHVTPQLTSKNNTPLMAASRKEFTSPSVTPSASFLQQGSILNPQFSDGLPIMAVNLPWVDVNYYRVNNDYYLQALTESASNQQYAWSVENLAKNGVLVSTQKYDTKAKKNQKIQRVLKTHHIDALTKPGIYIAIMRSPNNYESYQVARFSVSQLGHEISEYSDHYLVSISAQHSGKGVDNVAVAMFDHKHKQLNATQYSDHLGQVKISKSNKLALLTFTLGNDFTAVNINQSQPLNLADFNTGGRANTPLDLFVFGARDLYRRGEQFTYYALLRDQDGRRSNDMPLQAKLSDPNGNVIKTSILQSDNGLYQFDHQLASDVLTGHYQLTFTLAKQHFNHQFSVEDFMPQRLEIKLDEPSLPLTRAGNSQQPLTGLFLYGAPASDHKVDGLLQLKTSKNIVESLPDFYFGEHKKQGIVDHYPLDAITLNKEGLGSLLLEDRWHTYNQALVLNGFAYLYEKGGRKVTKQFEQRWWPHQEMIGIKPHFDKLTSDSESNVSFDIARSDFNGNLSNDNVMISLVRHHKEYYWEHSNQGGWQRHQRSNIYPVWQKNITLPNDKPLTISAPVAWGEYEIIVSSTKDKSVARLFFDAGEQWYWRWSQNNNGGVRPDQIDIALDKASYNAGDLANVKIDSPYAGQAWLRIESNDLLWQQQIKLSKGVNNVSIPIKDWQRHDVYLTAYLISPMSKDKAIKRALGLTHLPLNRDKRALSLVIDAPVSIKPNLAQPITVSVKNASNNTRVVLAAVDVGVLNLHNFKTPDPLAFFFAKRQYNVAIRDNFNDIIAPNDYAKANILWGGGAEMARGGQQANAQVQIVSFLSAPTAIDSVTKTASFNIDVPYFNGRLRVFAIAFDDNNYASEMVPMTVADDIVSQINMPRFLAIGDKSKIKLDLTNTTKIEQTLTVNINAPDLAISQPQKITLAPKASHTISLEAAPTTATQLANIDVSIVGETYQVKRQWQLSVRHAYPAQRRSLSQSIKPEKSLSFAPDVKDWHQDIQLSVSIATRPQFDLTEQINQLYRFPLGCLEQTSSRLYPWLVLPPATQQTLQKELVNINRDTLIETGVARILSMQVYSGGLSLWGNNGEEAPWLSVYGAQVLLKAKEAGIFVPAKALEKLLSRLNYYLRRGNFSGYGDINDYRFSTKAYSALVLASLSRANQSHMRQLIKSISDSKSPLAIVQLAAAFELMGDQKRSAKLIKTAKQIPYQQAYSGNYASNIRDKALMIHLLLKHQLDQSWAQELAFSLWQDKQSRQWFSTQERLALVLADTQLAQNFGDDFNYTLTVADTQFTGPDNGRAFYRIDGQAIHKSRLTNTSEQLLFVDQMSQGYPLNPPERKFSGIEIRRDYYDLSGRSVDLDTINSGDQYLVHIRVRSQKESLRDIMVVDLLPAGFEIENSTFDASVQRQNIIINGQSIGQRLNQNNVDYQGYLDDRYIASISVNTYRETELFYQVQAVTPGVYKHPPVMAESMYRHDVRAVGQNAPTLRVK